MTIDLAVAQKIHKMLKEDNYCTVPVAQEIASTTATETRDSLISHEIHEIRNELDKMSLRLERLWTTVDGIQDPKYPKLNRFFHFEWIKFWNWNWGWLKFWQWRR